MKILSIAALFVIILASCTKDASQINSGKRIVEIIPSGADSIGYVWFTYDNQNRLIRVKDSIDHYPTVYYSDLQYDNQGRVVKVITTGDITSNVTLLYNNNNQVMEQILKVADTSTIGQITRYYYDDKNRMIRDSVYVYGDLNATNADEYITYAYDNNDNLINKVWHARYNGQWVAQYEIDYLSYDNKLNAYRELKALWYIGEDEALSKNNVLSYALHYPNSPSPYKTTFTYTYDNNSLITDIARDAPFPGSRHFVYN